VSLGGKITLDGDKAAELLLLSSMTGVKAKEFTDMTNVSAEDVKAAGKFPFTLPLPVFRYNVEMRIGSGLSSGCLFFEIFHLVISLPLGWVEHDCT
jgi:hypothetical protein